MKYGVQFEIFHPYIYRIRPETDMLIDVQVDARNEADATLKAVAKVEEILNTNAKQLKVSDVYAETNES